MAGCRLVLFTWLVAAVASAAVPTVMYSTTTLPTPSGALLCYHTAPATMADPSAVFVFMACVSSQQSSSPYIGTYNFDSGSGQLVSGTPTGLQLGAYSNPAIDVDHQSVLVYTTQNTGTNQLMYANTQQVLWRYSRGAATATIPYDSVNQIAFTTVNDQTGSSLWALGINATTPDTPDTLWHLDLNTFGSRIQAVGNAIFYENNVYYVLSNAQVVAFNTTSQSPIFPPTTPCSLTIDGTPQMYLVNMGRDANGPLDALLIVANTTTAAKASQFQVCRMHHGAYKGGDAEWTFAFSGDYYIIDITGGPSGNVSNPGYLFFSVYETQSMKYSVIQMVSNGTYVRTFARDPADRDSPAGVMLPPTNFTGNPRVVMSINGQATAFDIDTGATVWSTNLACKYGATTFNHNGDPSVLCVQTGTVSLLNFEGGIIWQQQVDTTMQPTVYEDSTILVATRQPFGLMGLSFATGTAPPPPGKTGPNAGIVVLVIFLVIFVLLLGGAGFKLWKQRTIRRVVTKAQTDNEGYAGLNA